MNATGGVVEQDRSIAVVGLGYVGLPLAMGFAESGLAVTGIDASGARVEELNRGSSPIEDIPDERLAAALRAGFRAIAPEADAVRAADAVFVCVPTPVTATKDPDLGPVLSAAELVRSGLRAGHLVVLQSTTFPGTTTGPFRAVLERGTGLRAGVDFDLAFAPERVNPGDPASSGKLVPRLVGGVTPASTARAAALLRHINDRVVELSSPDAAEMAKLLENVFRNIHIACVNQLALLCERMGLDVWEVIEAAATKPFGFMKFTPGPGVGGHCIPVDPYYLSWRAREFASRIASSSSRRTSTWGCRATSWTSPRRPSTSAPAPSRAPASASSGSPSSPTSATRARRRRRTSWPGCASGAPRSASTTRTSPASATPRGAATTPCRSPTSSAGPS